jgi:hypothetical protein
MKIVIAGSRTINDYKLLIEALKNFPYEITEVVCGCAVGVDTLGETWATANNIKIKKMPANWNEYGKAAGVIRNRQMAEYADAGLILWDGDSPGSKNMVQELNKLNKIAIVKIYPYKIPDNIPTIDRFFIS